MTSMFDQKAAEWDKNELAEKLRRQVPTNATHRPVLKITEALQDGSEQGYPMFLLTAEKTGARTGKETCT